MRKLLIVSVLGLVLPLAFSNPATAAEGTQSALTAVSGQGTGYVVIAATAAGGVNESPPALTAQVEVAIHGAAPTTTFTVQRMVAAAGSGCTNLSEPLVLGTITTSAGGAGALHFVRHAPGYVRGSQFDIVLQAIGADGTVLQSACMTVTVK